MTTKQLIQESLELSVAERIQAVEAIWDTIADSQAPIQFSAKEIAGFEKEIDDYEKDPSSAVDWDEFKKTL